MPVRIELYDGSRATLQMVVQDDNYRHGYLEMPDDPIAELEASARLRLPACWPEPSRQRVRVVIPNMSRLREAFKRDHEKWMSKLPPIISIGVFWSLREPEGEGRNTFLTLAWLQDDMSPHISDDNRIAMRQMDWDQEIRLGSA